MSCAVQGVCSDAGSFDLTGAKLGTAIQEVNAAVEVALVRRDNERQTDRQVLAMASYFPTHLLRHGCNDTCEGMICFWKLPVGQVDKQRPYQPGVADLGWTIQ